MPREEDKNNRRRVVRCTGMTKSGAQCKRRTSRTNLCFHHLEEKYHVKIKPSELIDPATGHRNHKKFGMGLFTTTRRPPHRMIAPYTGEITYHANNDFGAPYAIQLNNHPPYKYVDSNKTTDAAGRYANTARRGNGKTNNAHLTGDPATGMAKVVSSERPIQAGREIYAKYGNLYRHFDH